MTLDCPRVARRVRWTPRLLLFLLFLLPLFPGCKGFDMPFGGTPDPDDPLKPGGPLPPERVAAQPAPPVQPPSNPQPVSPPPPPPTNSWPAPGSTTSNTTAAQTTAGVRVADPGVDVRTAGPGTRADPNGWTPSPPSGGSIPNAPLRQPEASAPGPASPPPGASGVTQAGGVVSVETIDQAFTLLKSYGMTWCDLKQDGSNSPNWLFDCYLSSKQNPGVADVYEGHGVGPNAAMKDVIDQIQRKQAGK